MELVIEYIILIQVKYDNEYRNLFVDDVVMIVFSKIKNIIEYNTNSLDCFKEFQDVKKQKNCVLGVF